MKNIYSSLRALSLLEGYENEVASIREEYLVYSSLLEDMDEGSEEYRYIESKLNSLSRRLAIIGENLKSIG